MLALLCRGVVVFAFLRPAQPQLWTTQDFHVTPLWCLPLPQQPGAAAERGKLSLCGCYPARFWLKLHEPEYCYVLHYVLSVLQNEFTIPRVSLYSAKCSYKDIFFDLSAHSKKAFYKYKQEISSNYLCMLRSRDAHFSVCFCCCQN